MSDINLIQTALSIWGAVFALIAALVVFLGLEGMKKSSVALGVMLVLNSVTLLSNAVAYIFRGNTTDLGWMMTRIGNFLEFACVPLMAVSMTFYLAELASDNFRRSSSKWLYAVVANASIHLVIVVVSQFTDFLYYFDEHNIYHRTNFFLVVSLIAAIELVTLGAMVVHYKKRITVYEFYSILAYLLLPFITNVIQTMYYGLMLNDIAITVALLCVFMTHEIQKSRRIVQQEKELLEHRVAISEQQALLSRQDAELAQKRLQISVSQMRPHFAFNTLGSIEQLCKTDPAKAADATHHFAQYLRKNLQSLSTTDLVPFTDEMGHVRTYIWLEKVRFGDDIDYREDIHSTSFSLPTLTIQPLVENAIKHGLMGKEEGAITICVSAEENDDCFRVTVWDDGCGFDTSAPELKSADHVGLSNVKERIQLMLNGAVTVTSKPGEGTTVVLEIPKV